MSRWRHATKTLTKPYHRTIHYYQRARRGFSDYDMFNADTFLARQMADILRWYMQNSHGVPWSYAKEDDRFCEDFEYMVAARDSEYTKYAALFEEYGRNGHAPNAKWKKEFGGLTDDEVHDMMTWLAEHFTELWD